MDLEKLKTAINDIGVRKAKTPAAFTNSSTSDSEHNEAIFSTPLRSRYPNFRWRLVPAVYCLFYVCYFSTGLSYIYVSEAPASSSNYTMLTYLIVIVAFAVAATTWFKGRWIIAVTASLISHAAPSLVSSIL